MGITSATYSQKYRNSGLFLEIHLSEGEVMKTNDFVDGINKDGLPINDYSASDFRIGWQTRGTQPWHHTLNLPYYGLGFYNSVFSNKEEIGYPAAIYFFFGGPFSQRPKSSFDYEFSFGLSYNWEPYDDIDNPFNVAIGSYHNAYIDLKIKYMWYFSKKVSLSTGLRATHFSNGALRHPNAGINLVAPFVGLRYDVVSKEPEIPFEQIKPNQTETTKEFNILLTSGRRAVKHTLTPNYETVWLRSVSLEYLKPTGYVFKYGVGLDLGIDQNRNLSIEDNDVQLASKKKQIFSGISLIGQFRANRMAVQAGLGYELQNNGKFYFSNDIYQRIGLRYYAFNHLFAGIAIKANNFSAADYIEWSLGYSIPRKSN